MWCCFFVCVVVRCDLVGGVVRYCKVCCNVVLCGVLFGVLLCGLVLCCGIVVVCGGCGVVVCVVGMCGKVWHCVCGGIL